MFRRTAYMQLTQTALRALMAELVAAVPVVTDLATAKVRFFTSETSPTSDSEYADFVWAALGGTGVSVTAFNLANTLSGAALHDETTVVAGAGPTAETIRGVALINDAGDTLIGAYRFDETVPIAIEGDAISCDVVIEIPNRLQSSYTEGS